MSVVTDTPQLLLSRLFEKWAGHWPDTCELLPASGSDRRYFRLGYAGQTLIGAWNPDHAENLAFSTFTRHFLKQGLNVPELLAEEPHNGIYLLRDLGDTTLYGWLSEQRVQKGFSPEIIERYETVVQQLPVFQVTAAAGLDLSVC